MTDQKDSRLKTEWREVKPAVYERNGYSPEQTQRLSQRPNALIKAAIQASTKSRDAKNNRR